MFRLVSSVLETQLNRPEGEIGEFGEKVLAETTFESCGSKIAEFRREIRANMDDGTN